MKRALNRRTIKRTSNNKGKEHTNKGSLKSYKKYITKAKKLYVDDILSKDEYDALHKKDFRKLTLYEKYVIRAKELKVDTILTEGEYHTTIKFNTDKGRQANPDILARWQFHGEHTDAQIEAMLHAAKLQNPKITRGQFIRAKGWETIDKQASDLYEEIQASDEYQRLEAEIERLENKGRDIDSIDSRRLRNLRADKAAMLHQISQQIYGSE